MRAARRILVTAASVVCVLSAVPAAPAAADTWSRPPADCYETQISLHARSLTCTNRPANQQWYADVQCVSGWVDVDVHGNHVTGNGTSSATCPANGVAVAGEVQFVVVG